MSATRKALGAVRYASRTTGVNLEKWLTWVALGGVAYVVYQFVSTASAAKDALNSVGSAIGTGLYEVFHPSDGQRVVSPTISFRFPDGTVGAVEAVDVDKDGRFTYFRTGRRYQLMKKAGDTKTYAVPV